jgi:hypothetical protein
MVEVIDIWDYDSGDSICRDNDLARILPQRPATEDQY